MTKLKLERLLNKNQLPPIDVHWAIMLVSKKYVSADQAIAASNKWHEQRFNFPGKPFSKILLK